MPRLETLALAMLVTTGVASTHADTLHLADGSRLEGSLLSLIVQDAQGQVRTFARGQVLAYTQTAPTAPPAPAGPTYPPRYPTAPPAVPGFHHPVPVPTGCAPMDCPQPYPPGANLVIDLRYRSNDADPALPLPSDYQDPGAGAEVFAYRYEHRNDRTQWLNLGEARRIHHDKLPLLDQATELRIYREMSEGGAHTAEEIQAKIDSARIFEHQMRYWFAARLTLEAGPWSLYVNFPRRRRHKIWNGVRFDGDGQPVVLTYDWSRHSSFGE